MSNPREIAHNYRLLALDVVDSTNAECMRRAIAGDLGNLWVTAATQQAGKARRGRLWVSEAGNLYASLLLNYPTSEQDVSTLPFVASLAVANAIRSCAHDDLADLAIKWPNDVLLGGRKISGILLEATMLANGNKAVVIGCGINCGHSPDTALYPTTSLVDQGINTGPEELFHHLNDAMHQALSQWDQGRGFGAIRSAWVNRATGIGSSIIARFDDHQEEGTFLDIDERGHLLLETADGIKTISAADIFFQNFEKEAKKPS